VEINTTLSAGSCTEAANAMKAHLTAAGYTDDQAQVIVPPDWPKQGNLIAQLAGSDAKLKPVLLLAHIDVVEARREDWKRDPFKLVEEDGFFYGRGSSDDKAMAAVFTDSMVRFKQEGFKPKRGLKLALTCGEESPNVFNGVKYLIENHRDLVDAAFALNEGGGGRYDINTGVYRYVAVLAAEGRVVGWTHVVPCLQLEDAPYAELAGLVVDESARGIGVGKVLLAAVEAWACTHGFEAMRVRSNVVRERAHRFYEREGYARVKAQAVFRKALM